MPKKPFADYEHRRRTVLKTAFFLLAASYTSTKLRAATVDGLAEDIYQVQTEEPSVQIQVIGFGSRGIAALKSMAKYPAPGLSFSIYKPRSYPAAYTELEGPAHIRSQQLGERTDRARAFIVVFDNMDAESTSNALTYGTRAKAQGLTIGVALVNGASACQGGAQRESGKPQALQDSFHSHIYLDPINTLDRTSRLLRSLSVGLAHISNFDGPIGVDYEDILTVLGESTGLAIGVGSASGLLKGGLAAQAAIEDLRPAFLPHQKANGILILFSAYREGFRLSELKLAMNSVRTAFGIDAHCIAGVYYNDLTVDHIKINTLDKLQVTIFLTSSG